MRSRCDQPDASFPREALDLFTDWYAAAHADPKVEDASAVNLATADRHGRPSSRMVLLKTFDASGFVFFTNLTSRKGQDLDANAHAALCFYWPSQARQIRIEGKVCPVAETEADAYFATRPRQSQIGAWASRQSSHLPSEAGLMARVAERATQFAGRTVPRPPFWSGFRLIPKRIEFWREGRFRLHHRTEFQHQASGAWVRQKLYP